MAVKHVLSFVGPATGLTRAYRYQVMHLESLDQVQLWSDFGGTVWEVGHSKPIPSHLTATEIALIMRDYIHGLMSYDEYNAAIPN